MSRQMFLNLAVKDLPKSKGFFSKLGFSFNPQFTNDQAAAMIVADNIFVMLVAEPYFQTFTSKPIADAAKTTEALICISADSRTEVDEMVRQALAAGGSPASPVQDHGWMYGHSFQDPDGHHWEVAFIDSSALPDDVHQPVS